MDLKAIQPIGKCPKCNGSFKRNKKGFIECPIHEIPPKRFAIQKYHEGKKLYRGTNIEGKTLRSQADAVELLKIINREIDDETFSWSKWKKRKGIALTCESYLWLWFNDKSENLAPSNPLSTHFKYYILPYYKDKDIRKIVSLKPFYRILDSLSPQGKKLTEKFKYNVINTAYNFFKETKEYLWEEWQIIIQLPSKPVIDIPEHIPQILSKEIRLKIIEIIDKQHKPIFTFYLLQGCRPGEVRALKGDCIDYENNTICYKRTWSKKILMERTKGKKARWNIIFDEVKPIIPKVFPKQFIFTYKDKPYTESVMQKLWRKYLNIFNKKYNISLDINLYEAGKHSFGSEMVNKGISLNLLKEWYGHTDIRMTEKYAKMNVIETFKQFQATSLNNDKPTTKNRNSL